MFIGREKEIELIQKYIDTDRFEFGIIYGRRRIGKTTLIKEIMKKNNGIYFVASEMDFEYNLLELSKIVAEYYSEAVTFNSLEMIFEYLIKKSAGKKVTIIIDEFTYLFTKEQGILSVLQNIIDNKLINSNVKLILSGSQVGMVEDVISYKKPLYGRTTFKIKIKAFDYFDSAKFFPQYSYEDKVRAYGVFGGTPYYLSKVNDSISLKENILNLILNEGGILVDETEFFLRQELRSISSYSMIINSISTGATRLNEISTKSQVNNTGTTSKYINTLRELDIIEKEICFGEGEKSKKTLYKFKDNFFNFYYRFIHPNKSKLAILSPEAFYMKVVSDRLDEYTSFIFEKVCYEFLKRNNFENENDVFYEIGRYWGNNKRLKREVEIDIVTKDDIGISVFECKWTNELFRKSEALDLMDESGFLKPYRVCGFSRNGFSDDAIEILDSAYQLRDLFSK